MPRARREEGVTTTLRYSHTCLQSQVLALKINILNIYNRRNANFSFYCNSN